MKTFLASDLSAFKKVIREEVFPLVKPKTLFLLSGELGAGKTELIKTLAELFQMQDVQSPTFAFHHAYTSKSFKFHHVDLYRMKNEDDLESTGFWDLFENEQDALFVEWANLLSADVWPWDWDQIVIEIKKISLNERELTIKPLLA